ncbi:biogenesis of lysosome-related organelles complex 1 subunit 6 [Plakobranchus ocellatus]|uniref:Biogenesis of lysosome-related organelles complex 1 subunit 6 n=1 Tax=Plakobranchus ocellatus TaxID=259542 RepID=A0AAV4BTX5_9GAST|nr:biogenesis of lysosome-related organelles complex 1 subunit 6 [Plakobranchus ocellatus]
MGENIISEEKEAMPGGEDSMNSGTGDEGNDRKDKQGEEATEDAVKQQEKVGEHDKNEENGHESPSDFEMSEKTKSLSVQEPTVVDASVIDLLTNGFVEKFLPGLRKSQTTIDQIRSSQTVLLETVQQETAKFRDCLAMNYVEDTMVKARHYHNKLLRLRREMTNLHEKSKKLKKRALKLQQQKQTEELTRAHSREHELEKERMLTARLATSPPSPT